MPTASCCLLVFYFAENKYQMESKCNETFWRIFLDQKTQDGPKKYQRGAPRGAQPTRARLGGLARPGGLCLPRWPPTPPLRPINPQIFQKPYESRRNTIPAATSSRTTRSNLDTITEGFIILIGASPMMRE